jgi:hypothetical protein
MWAGLIPALLLSLLGFVGGVVFGFGPIFIGLFGVVVPLTILATTWIALKWGRGHSTEVG